MTSLIDTAKIKGVMVAVECDLCDGARKVYEETARFPSVCPRCHGDGVVRGHIGIDGLKRLLGLLPPEKVELP